ncbi:WD40/YVTN/BNR-like repeat-containing protein [Phytohabitans sp. LJ34]|uniref:WD40/YVTN/BNR-like repeat-containing protein n=1 Tax=Phytohabitans sp. LJ34 TaxID=3452217 RepID=UPI003F8ABFC1
MPDIDFDGLGRAAETAFKPHFADVVRRHARRQRRVRVAGAALVVTAVGVGGAAVGLAGDGAPAPGPGGGVATTPPFGPSTPFTPDPAAGGLRYGAMVVGDLDHMYIRWNECRGVNCPNFVAATADGGATWRSTSLPVAGGGALIDLRAVGPHTLVARSQADKAAGFPPAQTWHASADGGVTWREIEPREVAAIPDGWVVLDELPFIERIVAADPATGDVVSVPQRGLSQPRVAGGLPPSAGLWVSGYTGTDTAADGHLTGVGSVVEWSRDGGRGWERHAFTEPLVSSESGFGSVAVATEDGRTVYAVGRVGGTLRIHRTVDGGRTWTAMPARYDVGGRSITAAMGAGGRLLIQAGPEGGQPALLLESVDGGTTVRALPAGPGGAAVQVPGGYAQSGHPFSKGAWLSEDGVTWRYVGPPAVR